MRLRSLGLLAAALLLGSSAHAAQAATYVRTGEGVRHKKVGFIHAKVYTITSDVSSPPPAKSKQAMIAFDGNKMLTWRMLRSVDGGPIEKALREAYAKNGYGDQAKINQFLQAFRSKLPKGAEVRIVYDPATQTTSVTTSTGGRAAVEGEAFMRATWSIWFGNIDEPGLSDALLSRLPSS